MDKNGQLYKLLWQECKEDDTGAGTR